MSDPLEKNNWLEKNTFHHGEFWDILKLVEEKERKNLTISLCIPTLNEEKTIGKEVLILRSELMERYPLIDEFAVIDSGSQDNTLEVAGNYGADTYLASDILPQQFFRETFQSPSNCLLGNARFLLSLRFSSRMGNTIASNENL